MTADIDRELKELAQDIDRANKAILGRLAERGVQLLRAEVPKKTRNLMQGVAPPDIDYKKMQATLTVSAMRARTGARTATLIGEDGEEKKKVSLRAQDAYDYAAVVASGYKPQAAPKRAKAFIVPVSTAPTSGSYLKGDDGQIYVVRRQIGAIPANPYDERAARRLEDETENIALATLKQFFE
jgi:hypothetical protein